VEVAQFPELPEELSIDEIEDIVRSFGEAARRAKEWGFDAVQLHGAHGYLLNQFLSPLTNRRSDGYGGSIENRSRFVVEVYSTVREIVGADYPVLIKLNASDNLEGGLSVEDAMFVAQQLSERGIDAIEVSAGTPSSGDESPARAKINTPEKEAYHLGLAQTIKNAVSCPVMVIVTISLCFRSLTGSIYIVSPLTVTTAFGSPAPEMRTSIVFGFGVTAST
jgi:2,4-dienoyl-CoA reductase-like NADH-dependent reductase (Old Yellow Enzyme family)